MNASACIYAWAQQEIFLRTSISILNAAILFWKEHNFFTLPHSAFLKNCLRADTKHFQTAINTSDHSSLIIP